MQILLSLQLALLVVAITVNSALAFFVYKNNRKSATNLLYVFLSLFISAWLIANYISLHPAFLTSSLFWIRSTIFLAAPMSAMFFLMASTLPRARLQTDKKTLIAIIFATLSVMAINISPYAFTAVEIVDGSPQPAAGPALLPFTILSTTFSALAV